MGMRAVLCLALLVLVGCRPARSQYEQRAGDPDGIGKWYLGREIAHTMSAAHADWLDRPEREREERPRQMVRQMRIAPTDIIADIGCGTGYHSLMMAQLAPGGRVYAVDIQTAMLDSVFRRSMAAGLANVEPTLGTGEDPDLPAGRIDKVLMVDVYHELAYPQEMMEAVVHAMKPGALLFLVEFRGEDNTVPIKRLHRMTAAQAEREMEAAGLRPVRRWGGLPWQHFLVFQKP